MGQPACVAPTPFLAARVVGRVPERCRGLWVGVGVTAWEASSDTCRWSLGG